ncbi:serine/threonine-protein kinase pim-2-like [Dendronephthya gigantea]|uniref:serine/threonine-protein kinase pim-2-like n=1 Tax=Dendronephthya gigantea TaxID=151771 RepID=UPI00106A6E48|nr:serine/threonine-protein kinase pim-2-like [Dendronephthya gigantea]
MEYSWDCGNQHSAGELFQISQSSQQMLQSCSTAVPDSTNESIYDVKRKRNILKEKLIKWKIMKECQVKPFQPSNVPRVTRVVDGENLVEVCKSKGVTYYYIENGLIGEGGFGGVFKGYAIKGTKKTPVALKFVNYKTVREYRKDKDLGDVPSEVYFLKRMKDHPNVIKFYHYQSLSSEEFVIICERPTNCKDLRSLMWDVGGFFTEDETQQCMKKLVNVVLAMSKKNIVHRDLKLENILYDFDTGEIKLLDFGLAGYNKPGNLVDAFCGTPYNMPPEYILHELYDPCKEAVRSIGVMIYEMLHGEPPFTDYTTFADVISGPPKLDDLSEDLQDLMRKLFSMDPAARPSIKQIAKHSWLRVKRSFTERLSSFFRRIFLRRRGSYDVFAVVMTKQTSFQALHQTPGSKSPTISGQSSAGQSSNQSQINSQELLETSMEENYQEWPITVDEPASNCDQ